MCPVRRSAGGVTRRDSFAGQWYPVCPRSSAQLGAHAQMPQPAAPSVGASGQPPSWLPGTGRAPAPTSPRADPVSWSWFLCASCLRKPPWKTQTHDSWVDKYASVSPKGGQGEAGRGRQSQEDPPGQAEPTACSPCVCTWIEELCVHVFACMHDCLCCARVGRAVEPTLGFCVVLGSKPRIPHLSEGGDRPNKGRVAPIRPVGSRRVRSRAVAVSPGSSAGPHT